MPASREYNYEITVSAMLGRSMGAVLGSWVADAQRAKAKIDAIFGAPTPAPKVRGGKDPRVAEAEKAAKELEKIRERENNQILRDVEKHARAEERAHERAARHVAAIKERYFREEQRRGEQADAEQKSRREKIISGAFSNMRRVAGAASRVAGELTSGFGVNFDLSSAMQRSADVDEAARRTAISGMGAKGQNATEADVQRVAAAVRKAGDEARVSYNALGAGLEEFVSKSSDLETGEKALGRLAKIARATGTDVNFLVSAAGDVNKTLDDTPDKAEQLLDIMTLVAAQSAKGNVEVKDFAQYMGRITAGAFKFEGTKGQNIGILAGLAQMAAKGGAAGPAEATRSAQAFAEDLTKGKALERFQRAGIQVFTDDKKTTLRSPEKIITDFLKKSGGSLADLSTFFQNKNSRNVLNSLSSIYTTAGGGDKGIAAVSSEFKKYSETMSSADVDKRFALSAEGRKAKAEAFQNNLDRVADTLANRVLPEAEKLAPAFLKIADAGAGIIAWAVSNPFAAIGTAIAGSIAASIGKVVIGEAIGKAIAGGMGGKGLAIGAITATVAMAYLAIREFNEEKQKAGEAEKAKTEATEDLVKRAQVQLESGKKIDPETMNELIRRRADLEGARNRAGRYDANEDVNFFEKAGAKIYSTFAEGDDAKMLAEYEGGGAENAKSKETLDKQAGVMDALLKAATDARRNPSADEIGGAVAKAVAPLVQPAIAAPTTGRVSQ
jgi:surfactin synthase thioesterase subunit